MASDIEIARAAKMKPIQEIGTRLNIPEDSLLPYGRTKPRFPPTTLPTSMAARTAS